MLSASLKWHVMIYILPIQWCPYRAQWGEPLLRIHLMPLYWSVGWRILEHCGLGGWFASVATICIHLLGGAFLIIVDWVVGLHHVADICHSGQCSLEWHCPVFRCDYCAWACTHQRQGGVTSSIHYKQLKRHNLISLIDVLTRYISQCAADYRLWALIDFISLVWFMKVCNSVLLCMGLMYFSPASRISLSGFWSL